jgi:serine protease Do
MNPLLRTSSGRRTALALLAALAIVGGAGLAVAQSKSEAKASVSVKVDTSPLPKNADTALTFSPIVKRVAPSVVRVEARENVDTNPAPMIFNDPFFGPFRVVPNGRRQEPVQPGVGSGVIVSTDGYILTNNHVVAGADKLKVFMTDGRELPATVVGTDERTDVAVIKVNAKDLPAVTFAESANIEVGDRVLAIGNPFGLGQTVTTGIISAKDRQIGILNQTDRRNNAPEEGYEDFIQTDAAINPGNSGGALVDMQGRLVGINTAILSGSGGSQGAGFAIPADLARRVMNSLVRDGQVVRGYLGVGTKDLSLALAEQLKVKDPKGALVMQVFENTPAEKAGLKNDDVIVKVNGKPVTDSQRLRLLIADIAPGEDAKLDLVRDGKEQILTAKIGEQENAQNSRGLTIRRPNSTNQAAKPESRLDGVVVADLNNRLRNEFEIPTRIRGAVVTEVDPNSAAADAGLAAGDVILEIDRKAVNNANDAIKFTEDYANGKTLLRIYSRGVTNLLAVDEANAQPAQPNPRRNIPGFGR